MGRYVDWEFLANQFPLVSRGPSRSEVESFYIAHAEAELDGMLAGYYTIPFSSNNLTAQQLAGLGAYIKMGLLKDEQLGPLIGTYRSRLKRLRAGEEKMITVTDSGAIEVLEVNETVQGAISSTTEDYHPVFGMGSVLDMEVSSLQAIDEEDARL